MDAGWGMTTHLLAFVRGSTPALSADRSLTPGQVLTRATGSLAFLQLSFLLCIGTLARLTPSFKPFTHNRGLWVWSPSPLRCPMPCR